MMRKLATIVGAIALVAGTATAASAVDEPPCVVDYNLSNPAGYADTSGHVFIGGLSTVNRVVTLKRTNCDALPAGTTWKVTGPGFEAEGVASDLIDETVAVTPPMSNRRAGFHGGAVDIVIVRPAIEADPTATPPVLAVPAVRSEFFRDITLKRRVIATKTDGTPEPVKKGLPLTIKSRFSVADWSDADYVALSGRTVRLQSRNQPGVWDHNLVVDTDVTDAAGRASLVLTATSSQVWRFEFKGSATLGHADAVGDFVRVR